MAHKVSLKIFSAFILLINATYYKYERSFFTWHILYISLSDFTWLVVQVVPIIDV